MRTVGAPLAMLAVLVAFFALSHAQKGGLTVTSLEVDVEGHQMLEVLNVSTTNETNETAAPELKGELNCCRNTVMAQRRHSFDIVSPFRQGELHHKPVEKEDELWPIQTCTNPAGFSFEMITVTNATGLKLAGDSSEVATWFPGG